MAPKRKGDADTVYDQPSARERKKQKTAIARTIAVQSGTPGGNALAGPSKSVRFNSMQGLPGSLDVERFAEARAFEINAMHDAMQSASSNATQRAWQQLPRHLRRRAASHDVRRVPLRLRDKARAEMDPMRRKALGRSMPKRGKAKREKRTEQLLKRQRDKTWLETHIWHAKRMKMENLWGYRLAVEPTEKSFRPSHRASVHGSILHDASYLALIELQGPEDILRSTLDSCCDYQGPSVGAKRFSTGARACGTHIYKHGSYPFDLIGPATVIWRPTCAFNDSEQQVSTSKPVVDELTSEQSSHKRKKKSKGKGKISERPQEDTQWPPTRTVWIYVHPVVVTQVHTALRTAASYALKAVGQVPGRPESQVEIGDMREKVNVFEITGPKSSQVIKGALKPLKHAHRTQFNQFWASLDHLQTTGSLPRGMIIGFTVDDPRLSFPPKNAKLNYESGTSSSSSPNVFPSAALAQSEIWEDEIRTQLSKPRFKKKDIDQRKANNLIPGTKLQATQKDDRIPVLLVQRSIESSPPIASSSCTHAGNSPTLHGWTLIIPSGWAMPFLSSLIFTGTRVGGQRERQTQAFEGGCAYFPRDYPFTDAYDDYADDREEQEKSQWERRPPAKRTNFEKLGTRSPWKPDWDVVLGLEEPSVPEAELISAQRENPPPDAAEAAEKTEKKARTWLLRGTEVPSTLQNLASMFNPAAGLLDYVNQLRIKRGQDPLNKDVRADELWNGALVTVKIILFDRGNPGDLAMIYSIDDEEAKKWYEAEKVIKKGVPLLQLEEDSETELSKLVPVSERIIGYVTTGHYSLSRGTGQAIGAIPVSRLFELRQQADRLRVSNSLLVKLRDRGEDICRAARLEVLAG